MKLHPVAWLAISIAVLAQSFVANAIQLTFLMIGCGIVLMLRPVARSVGRRLAPVIGISMTIAFLFTVAVDAALDDRGTLFAPNPTTIEEALRLSLRMAVLASAPLLVFTAAPLHHLAEFMMGHHLGRSLAYPLLYTAAMRQIFSRRLTTALEAQQCRGLTIGGSLLQRARATVPLLGPIVISSLHAGIWRAASLHAIGLTSPGRYTQLWIPPARRRDKFVAVIGLMLALASVAMTR